MEIAEPTTSRPSNRRYSTVHRVLTNSVKLEKHNASIMSAKQPTKSISPSSGKRHRTFLAVDKDEEDDLRDSLYSTVNEMETQQRPMSIVQRKFSMLSELMPDIKVDTKMKRKIVESLKEAHCWSDSDDDYNDNSRDKSISGISEADKAGYVSNTSVPAPKTLREEKAHDRLSQAKSPRAKAHLVKPKQLAGQSKRQQLLQKDKIRAREHTREMIAAKAVKLLLNEREKERHEKQQNTNELLNQLSAFRQLLIKRTAMARVSKAVSTAIENVSLRQLLKEKEEAKLLAWKKSAGRLLLKAIMRCRIRRFVKEIMAFAKNSIKRQQEQAYNELWDYRIRVAQRKMEEDRLFKTWKLKQKSNSTFPVKPLALDDNDKSAVTGISSPRYLAVSPQKAPKVAQVHDASVVNTSTTSTFPPVMLRNAEQLGYDLASMPDEEKLKFARTRPDLAPFSTMVNNMIQNATMYKKECEWDEVASVSLEYVESVKTNKSAAYRALEKICGLKEADVTRRKLEVGNAPDNILNLKSFGSSIISI